MLDLVTAGLLEGSNSFLNRSSLASTEIEKAYRLISLLEILNSLNVTFCKVNDMNIITDSRAVRCVVICSENGKAIECAASNL